MGWRTLSRDMRARIWCCGCASSPGVTDWLPPDQVSMSEPLQQRARRALTRRLEGLLADRLGGDPAGMERDRVRFLADNLVPSLSAWQISVLSHQLARGDGGELDDSEGRPNLHCAWSSAALVANCFGA